MEKVENMQVNPKKTWHLLNMTHPFCIIQIVIIKKNKNSNTILKIVHLMS
jgi:hypothetical protein